MTIQSRLLVEDNLTLMYLSLQWQGPMENEQCNIKRHLHYFLNWMFSCYYLVLCQYVGMFGNYLGYLHFVSSSDEAWRLASATSGNELYFDFNHVIETIKTLKLSLYRNHLWGIQLFEVQFWTWQQLQCSANVTDWSQVQHRSSVTGDVRFESFRQTFAKISELQRYS